MADLDRARQALLRGLKAGSGWADLGQWAPQQSHRGIRPAPRRKDRAGLGIFNLVQGASLNRPPDRGLRQLEVAARYSPRLAPSFWMT